MCSHWLLHLVVAEDEVLECVDICYVLKLLTICLNEMLNDDLDVFALDEFEKFKTGRVQKVVSRHCVEEDLQDRLEKLMLDNLSVMCFIVKCNDRAEIFEGGYVTSVDVGARG